MPGVSRTLTSTLRSAGHTTSHPNGREGRLIGHCSHIRDSSGKQLGSDLDRAPDQRMDGTAAPPREGVAPLSLVVLVRCRGSVHPGSGRAGRSAGRAGRPGSAVEQSVTAQSRLPSRLPAPVTATMSSTTLSRWTCRPSRSRSSGPSTRCRMSQAARPWLTSGPVRSGTCR